MKVSIFSFGFKYETPQAQLLVDVRFLPNPYWEPSLRSKTGLEAPLAAYILDNAKGQTFLRHFESFLLFMLQSHKEAGKEVLHCGIGCTGGRHRSVAVSEHIYHFLTGQAAPDDILSLEHRDIHRDGSEDSSIPFNIS
jgi:UPF0042 nucleotide-binding protein